MFVCFFNGYDTGFSGLGLKTVSVDVSLSPIVAPAKTASLRDEIAYFTDAISNRRDERVAWRRLKRRITHGGSSVLISFPREAISLRGQRQGLPIIQGQGGGNAGG